MVHFRRLAFESLEARKLLAADLELLSVEFTNAVGELTGTTPTVGEKVYVRAHWQTTDVVGNYNVRWEMDGVATEQRNFSSSGGTAVDRFWFHGGWIAQPGASHSLSVIVDSTNAIDEENEANNSITRPSFTPLAPTSLAAKFTIPLAGQQNEDWVLGGYVDVDPRSFFDDPNNHFSDYQGSTTTTRDFHNGLDFEIPNFAAQDTGVEVRAAAPGTVIEVRDGFFDRQTELTFGDPGNYVFVEHGGGWVTQYYHLRRDSIAVGVNDSVTTGQVLGLIGSSGNSAGAHLHFEVQHNKTPVDPFASPSEFFVSPPAYVFDASLPNRLLDFGVTNDIYNGVHTFGGPPSEHRREAVSHVDTFPTTPQEVYAYARFTSVETGDTWKAQLYRPDGTLVNDYAPVTFSADRPTDGGWYRPGFTENIPGTWRVDFLFNDIKVGEQLFEVGAAAPEMRLFDVSIDDEVYLIDGRQTPIEFGASDFDRTNRTDGHDFLTWQRNYGTRASATRNQGDATRDGAVDQNDLAIWEAEFGMAEPTKTFRVENHGYGDLTIADVQLPAGYAIDEPLDATIVAGASDTFRVKREAGSVGVKMGDIQINNNDTDESAFAFAVEGEVAAVLHVFQTMALPTFDKLPWEKTWAQAIETPLQNRPLGNMAVEANMQMESVALEEVLSNSICIHETLPNDKHKESLIDSLFNQLGNDHDIDLLGRKRR